MNNNLFHLYPKKISGNFWYLSYMKYIITESQNLQLKKINYLREYIEKLLSKYEWFNGVVKINLTSFTHGDRRYPLVEIFLDTGGISYYEI